MKEITVKGEARTALGKKACRDLRRQGGVPCVLYGVERDENNAPVAKTFTVSQKELAKVLYTPNVYIVNLDIDGVVVKAILKDLQCDFVKDTPVHVDFYQITEEHPIVMDIPVKLNGLAEGVKAGGKLVLQMRKLKVRALYNVIPERLIINVAHLGLGKTVKVGELQYEGLELLNAKEAVVCAVKLTRAARGAAAAAGN